MEDTYNLVHKFYFSVGNQFDAPSGGGQQAWGQQFGGEQFPGQQFLNDPMANMAMQYGTSLAGQGKDIVHKNVSVMLKQ